MYLHKRLVALGVCMYHLYIVYRYRWNTLEDISRKEFSLQLLQYMSDVRNFIIILRLSIPTPSNHNIIVVIAVSLAHLSRYDCKNG